MAPTHENTRVGRPAKIYFHQFYADTRCCLEDLSRAMADRGERRERVKGTRAVSTF